MSWDSLHDFVLTEFRVEVHARENTNIALHRPARASHRCLRGCCQAHAQMRPDRFVILRATDS